MSCDTIVAASTVVEDEPFFAPAPTDMLDTLLGQYRLARDRIRQVAEFASGELASSVLNYFLDGNKDDNRGRSSLELSAKQLFDEAGAVASLNAAYWSKALALTDVLDLMPQKRRNEWHEQMRKPQGERKDWSTVRRERDQWPERFGADGEYLDPDQAWVHQPLPEFSEENVRGTIMALLNMRAQFFGERVDGIFRGLSGEHVTNAPEAFGKRMIIARVLTCYATVDHSTSGLINDLRCVIAKFMGRDEPKYDSSEALIRRLKGRWGEWVAADGGALRIRLYKKGTAHLEVHPDMAWRLNQVLASIYPLAIPAQFRQRPKRRLREFDLIKRPLPFQVVEALSSMEEAREKIGDGFRGPEFRRVQKTRRFRVGGTKDALTEAELVLQAIGGTKDERGVWHFDYEPADVLSEIVVSGRIPDQRAHQFYPTPESVGRVAVELADIGPGHTVLEPSAGNGDLAALLPADRTTCVEIADLRCNILRARGFTVEQADFLAWAEHRQQFDRVVMNPPFSEGRWKAHIEAAAGLVAHGGRLVAVLPASAAGQQFLPGFDHKWSRVFDNEFAGTSISVVILSATREGAK